MIIHGDCLDAMPTIASNSVDAIVTDPPYGIDYQSEWKRDVNGRRNNEKLFTPKIANDKNVFTEWLPEAFRITKDGGSILCFCRWDVQEIFRLAIESSGFKIKSQVIWDKVSHGMGDLVSSFGPQHEVIWFAIKGKFKFPGGRPKSIIRCPRVPPLALMHPNQKPLFLMKSLCKAVCPDDGTILDPFCGSGTTGIAAKSLGLKFIGIEINEGYCDIAEKGIHCEISYV